MKIGTLLTIHSALDSRRVQAYHRMNQLERRGLDDAQDELWIEIIGFCVERLRFQASWRSAL